MQFVNSNVEICTFSRKIYNKNLLQNKLLMLTTRKYSFLKKNHQLFGNKKMLRKHKYCVFISLQKARQLS